MTIAVMTNVPRHFRFMFLALAVLAVLVRGMLPAGFMPSFDDGGKVDIVICTSYGPSTVSVDAGDGSVPAGHDKDESAVCIFVPLIPEQIQYQDDVSAPARYFSAGQYDDVHSLLFAHYLIKPWMAQGPPAA